MKSVIDTEFTRHTIIAVVHRFRFIERFDHVWLLESGELVEYDTPKALLGSESRFRRLYEALGR